MNFDEEKQRWNRDMFKFHIRDGFFRALVAACWGFSFGLMVKALMGW